MALFVSPLLHFTDESQMVIRGPLCLTPLLVSEQQASLRHSTSKLGYKTEYFRTKPEC